MDVRATVSILNILMLVFGLATSQNINETSKNATSDAAKECLTAKNVSGICVARQSCDHGTPAIDFTLFAPHGYTRPCAMEEVCCPPDAMVRVETNSSPASIDSDEDDQEFV